MGNKTISDLDVRTLTLERKAFEDLLRWIDGHIAEPIGWQELMLHSGLKYQNIQSMFYRYENTTAMSWIRNKRVAKRMQPNSIFVTQLPLFNFTRSKCGIGQLTHGFTLLELMIVVALIGILAAVAMPSYTQYLQRGRIADAVAGLAPMQSKLDQFFLDNRTYVGACGAAGTLAQLPSDTNHFTFSCTGLSGSSYTVTASGRNAMTGFAYSLSLTAGLITKSTDLAPTGWAVSNNCWVLKSDGSC